MDELIAKSKKQAEFSMTTINLFVYGTLKRGQRNHRLLAGQEFVGPARTLPHYRLYDTGSYPCLVEDADKGVAVSGEVWRVEGSWLPRLDQLEGAPLLFRRVEIAIEASTDVVFAYLYNGDVTQLKDCGDEWSTSPKR